MVINISVQYSGGLLPDIIMLAQGYYQWGTRLNTMYWLCIYNFFLFCFFLLCILLLPCVMVYYIVFCF